MLRRNILVRGLAKPALLCGRGQTSQGGPVWKNQRRRYLSSVRKAALARSIAPQGASCISADDS